MSLYTIGLDDLKIEYCENYDLSKASTFRIGGKATYAVYPKNDDELIKAIFLAESLEMKFIIIGLGSNVLFSDDGFDGAVIFTKKMNSYFSGNILYMIYKLHFINIILLNFKI